MRGKTLTEVLRQQIQLVNKGITIIEASDQETFLSYRELYSEALKGLSFLQQAGVKPADELIFQIDNYRTFIITFWACLLGGIIPVPLTIGQNDEHRQKLFNTWAVLNNPRLITAAAHLDKLEVYARSKGMDEQWNTICNKFLSEEGIYAAQQEGQLFEAKEEDIAFIQFSSGSTGHPKGVVLTHKNLITNIAAISQSAGYNNGDTMLSWMPLTHDMGLIGFHLNPLYEGINHYLIPTQSFIRRPALWFDKTSEHKISILCSPNFGYRYLLKNAGNHTQQDWDLSCVRILYNGAEPISVPLCDEFVGYFTAYGLQPGVMRPVYGLAEASLAVSFSPIGEEVLALHLDRSSLKPGDVINITGPGENALTVVNVGKAVTDCSIRIADHDNISLAAGKVGSVQIKGPNVTAGYYNNAGETEKVLTSDGWLNTGDLGFMQEDSLYITGRAKDIIFMNGQNYYPHDIERVAEEVTGIELNKIVVTGYFDDQVGKDQAIAFVYHRGDQSPFNTIGKALVAHISSKTGLQLDKVIPVKDIPRTTSGKLQRFRLLEQYREGRFNNTDFFSVSTGESPEIVDQPSNETEATLCELWTTVLKRKMVGVNQSFFLLGGDSLKAAEVAMFVMQEWQVDVPADLLYEKPTIRGLAEEITKSARQSYTPIAVATVQSFYPASSAQKMLYYAWEADKNSIAYNIPLAFRLNKPVDPDRLALCIRKLLARHDVYRMSFHWQEEPVFKIHDEVVFEWNSSEVATNNLPADLKTLVRPFDLAQQPLFRAGLLTTREQQQLLFLDFHHIIADGLSVHHFLDELMQLYNGQELPALSLQYKDYAIAEKEYLGTDKTRTQEAWWTNQLHGEWPLLDMPLDFPRPLVFDTSGEKIAFTLNKSLTGQLKVLAEAQQCSLHVLLFTLYNILLSKYTGQEELIVGIPVAGRRQPGLGKMQGMFVNNLPIRSTVKGEEWFTDLLQQQQAIIKTALRNQDYPFYCLLQKHGRERDSTRNPLFDTMFIYQNMGFPDTNTTGLTLNRYFFDAGISKYDISMEVFEEGQGISYYLEYATRLFKKETIIQFATHFEQLAQTIVNNPARRLFDVQVISARETELYTGQWHETTRNYVPDQTIHQLFKQQVDKTPNHIAIRDGETHITYRQLNEQADRLAQVLRQKGIAPNIIAGIFLQRSAGLIISILAVLKAGGCYLPIDTDLPASRVAFLVADSHCQVLITDDECTHTLPGLPSPGTRIVNLDHLETAPVVALHPGYVSTAHNLAYIIYTSGTTGKPKGVMIEHRSLVNYITWASAVYIKESKATFPLFTTISFDLTVTSVFTPLLTGNTIVIYREEDKELLVEKVIADNKVNVIKLTPSHLKIIAAGSYPITSENNHIKRFIVGGEQLETWLARAIYDKFGGQVEIYNEYGPTEATVGCMIYQYDPQDTWINIPIGLPAANTGIYLLDKYLRPVPAGINGELYISGEAVARGYLFNDELTSQRFIADPFVPNRKMYKTGDIARRLPNGIIAYIGRFDQQVKINGHRVELAEIENVLLGHEKVEQALVVVKKNSNGQQKLYAYYTCLEVVEEKDLAAYLAGKLPHYMIPALLIRIDTIPLTSNGKVDHAALPEHPSGWAGKGKTAPGNPLERLMVKTWSAVLGEPEIGVTDNFFEWGGDSIKAVQIAARLLDAGVQVAVKDILIYSTIQQIAEHAIVAGKPNTYNQGLAAGEKRLTPIESWFFAQQFEDPGHYNQTVLLACQRNLDSSLLAAAFDQLIAHHDGLRINYDLVKRALFYNNSLLDKKMVIETLDADVSNAPFILDQELLLKATIIREDTGKEKLRITAHHLLVDGISWRILLEDLYTLYIALENGEVSRLPLKTASLQDWEKQLTAYAATEDFERRQDYWKEATHQPCFIPMDYATTDWRIRHAGLYSTELNKDTTAFLLKEAYKISQTDMPVILNTALTVTLREWTGCDHFIIEQESHGRHLEEIDVTRTTGWFTALYPVQLHLTGHTLGEQLQSIKEQMQQVPGRGMDYGIQKYSKHKGESQDKQYAEIRLNYLGRFDHELNNDLFAFCNHSTGSDIGIDNDMTAKLELNAMVVAGVLLLEIRYNRKAHKETTIEWFAGMFLHNIELIVSYLQKEKEESATPVPFSVDLDQKELDALFYS